MYEVQRLRIPRHWVSVSMLSLRHFNVVSSQGVLLVKAGNSVTLNADDEIKLLAAKNTADQHSTNSNRSGSLGLSFGTDGLLFTASASGGRGKADAITSTQKAIDDGVNRFATGGTLTTSDIQNQASYKASSVGVSVGTGMSLDGKLAPQGTGTGFGKDSGNASSTTHAAISGVTGNKDTRTGDAESGIKKIFDADKVQKDINAQVAITQEFGRAAGKAVSNYSQTQRQELQAQLKKATTDEDKQAVQMKINDLNKEERAMNILIGAVTGVGASSITKEGLSATADQMRQLMIEDSQKFAGVTDGATTLTNMSGTSEGVRGDGVKVGGTRVDLDFLCGVDNKRCKTDIDENGVKQLSLNDKGQVQFGGKTAGMSLAKFLEITQEGKDMSGPTGGIQGMKGTLFGIPYASGSWPDKLIEAFSGTHDMIGGKVSGLYDEQGNIKRGMTDAERSIYNNAVTTTAILPSLPFAAAELLSPEVWKAMSILLKGAK